VTAGTREFAGPKIMGPGLERFRLLGAGTEASIEYCSNCKNCDITCPSNVPVAALNLMAKNEYYNRTGRRLRDWILAHGELFAKLGSPFAPLTNWGMNSPVTRWILQRVGITDRPLPAYEVQTLYRRVRALKQQRFDRKVVFFPGCFIGYNNPQVGMDLLAILNANQIEVIIPDVVCCGTPVATNGYLDLAEAKARHNVSQLAPLAQAGYPILTCCTSCGLMLKQEYQELYDIEGAGEIAKRHLDASEFLLELTDGGKWMKSRPLPGSCLYHAPCHLRAQGIGLPGLEILRTIPELAVREADAGCCGIAGSYGFKIEKHDISMKIGEKLFQTIREANPDTVVTECGTCQLQIQYATGAKVLHPVSMLRKAYRI
jgi:glycerol-3-phosphate dehydrogenase subunit C